jgi:hypothetical protein
MKTPAGPWDAKECALSESSPTNPGEGIRVFAPSPSGHVPGEPWTLDMLVRELIYQSWDDDWWDTYIQYRLAALEEAIASRRSRRLLRRKIREADQMFAWAGRDFRARRVEATFNEYLCDMADRERRHAA